MGEKLWNNSRRPLSRNHWKEFNWISTRLGMAARGSAWVMFSCMEASLAVTQTFSISTDLADVNRAAAILFRSCGPASGRGASLESPAYGGERGRDGEN